MGPKTSLGHGLGGDRAMAGVTAALKDVDVRLLMAILGTWGDIALCNLESKSTANVDKPSDPLWS